MPILCSIETHRTSFGSAGSPDPPRRNFGTRKSEMPLVRAGAVQDRIDQIGRRLGEGIVAGQLWKPHHMFQQEALLGDRRRVGHVHLQSGVIPAEAGIQAASAWMPAFAGMTERIALL